MLLRIGSFEIEAYINFLYVQVPLVGAFHLSKECGLILDGWKAVKGNLGV